ncbi:unnamed protein product [Calypogeia fissa]
MAPGIDCVPSLFCAEEVSGSGWDDESSSYGEVDLVDDLYNVVLQGFPVKNEQAISALLEKECRLMPEADYLARFQSEGLNAGARQNAISWMLKVQAYYNFGPLSVALSVNYMDRFLSRHELPQGTSWKLQLLTVACMSLAAKMEETEVPFLLDLQVVEVEHIFEARTIQRMELLVLSTLEWRMSAITPFSFIDYYFHRLGIDNTVLRSLLERVIELITRTLTNVSFLQYRPSAIAAAAVLCALDEIIPGQGAGYRAIFCELAVDMVAVVKCCQIMQDSLVDPTLPRRLSSKRKAFCSSSIPQSPVGVLEAATLFSCASESTQGSPEGSPSVGSVTASALKKRRLDELCNNLYTMESL